MLDQFFMLLIGQLIGQLKFLGRNLREILDSDMKDENRIEENAEHSQSTY